MNVTETEYARMTNKASPPSSMVKNALLAFLVGGAICTLGQALFALGEWMGLSETDTRTAVSCALIFLSAMFTALGLYCKLGDVAGAGTLVPITGFANAIAAAAIEFKSEGLVLGTGAKMFIIAGPVLVYGPAASVIYGVILWIVQSVQ